MKTFIKIDIDRLTKEQEIFLLKELVFQLLSLGAREELYTVIGATENDYILYLLREFKLEGKL